MDKIQGRPPKPTGEAKTRYLQIRVTSAEKEGFDQAAELAGLPMSTWVRERLRMIARRELKDLGLPVPFIHNLKDSR